MPANIHPSAIVHPRACLGENVRIGPFCQIHRDVIIGDNSVVEAYCELGYATDLARHATLQIGADSLIRSHSVFYAGSCFGDGLQTGHRVTVRENTQAGANLRLGTLCDIQGDVRFGDYCRLHSNVHIGKHSRLGNFVWIFPYVILTNDPTPPSTIRQGVMLQDYAVIATLSVLLPGITVGRHALVGAGSVVNRDVPEHRLVAGNPARIIRRVEEIRDKETGRQMYPWPRHFKTGYPQSVRQRWEKDFTNNEQGDSSV